MRSWKIIETTFIKNSIYRKFRYIGLDVKPLHRLLSLCTEWLQRYSVRRNDLEQRALVPCSAYLTRKTDHETELARIFGHRALEPDPKRVGWPGLG